MKVRVIQMFGDRGDFTVKHLIGKLMDVDEERATDLISRGLAEKVEPEPKSEPKPKPKRKPKK